jgi:hypothetical protein
MLSMGKIKSQSYSGHKSIATSVQRNASDEKTMGDETSVRNVRREQIYETLEYIKMSSVRSHYGNINIRKQIPGTMFKI